jgi:hypothetical protein
MFKIEPVYSLSALGVWTLLALCLWIQRQKPLVVQLSNPSAATSWCWLIGFSNLRSDTADLSGLRKRTMDFTHWRSEMITV